MASTSRQTEPMTEESMNRLRLRNAARVKASIEQLGRNWVLHPAHAVTSAAHAEVRLERVEVIDLRRMPPVVIEWTLDASKPQTPEEYAAYCRAILRRSGFSSIGDAFQKAMGGLAKAAPCGPSIASLIDQGYLQPIYPQGDEL